MRKYAKTFVAAAAIALGVSGTSWAKDDDEVCSNSTLNGVYVFHASVFNIVAGVAQPKAIIELIRFNGDGTIVGGGATVSLNGAILRSPPGGSGTYSVQSDCTGSIAFFDGGANPTFDLFIGAKPSELFMIQTGQRFNSAVFNGTAEWVAR